jgi:hypothetical protein
MTICSIGKNKKTKPVFVIRLSKNAKPEDVERTNLYATNSLLSKDYHILVIKSNKNIDIEFELFNIKDIDTTSFESFKEEIKALSK